RRPRRGARTRRAVRHRTAETGAAAQAPHTRDHHRDHRDHREGAIMTALLELRHVSRTYPGPETVTALHDVSLAVRPGQLVTIMGPSGSGKSTLLSLAGGLETPTEGTVLLSGRELAELSPRRLAEVRRR